MNHPTGKDAVYRREGAVWRVGLPSHRMLARCVVAVRQGKVHFALRRRIACWRVGLPLLRMLARCAVVMRQGQSPFCLAPFGAVRLKAKSILPLVGRIRFKLSTLAYDGM